MSILTSTVSALAHALPATRANRLLILIYHRVHARPDPMFPGEVDAARFDEQMSLLARHCSPLPLVDAVAGLRAGTLPPRAVTVTFDDGYADNAEVALPILLRHGVHAAFFVATSFLDGGRMWNDTVIEAVRRARGAALDLAAVGLGTATLGDDAGRGALAERILRAIKHRDPVERLQLASALADGIGAELPGDLMMNSAQVRQLAAAGMEVGAHTCTHPILRVLSDSDAAREIGDSRDALAAITGRRIRAFAYPNGRLGDDYTTRDRALVAESGFDLAVSTQVGAASAASDPFQLPRFTPWDRHPERWLARLFSAFSREA